MKILVVTNLYPPQHVGGYELGCRDVVEQLRARGHVVQVFTSNFCNGKTETPPGETEVERELQFNISPTDPPHDKRREMRVSTRVYAKGDALYWRQAQL